MPHAAAVLDALRDLAPLGTAVIAVDPRVGEVAAAVARLDHQAVSLPAPTVP